MSMDTGDTSTFVPAIAMTDHDRGRDAINLYSDIAGILYHHVVNLGCGHRSPPRRVNPNGDVSVSGKQLISKELRCDIIVKPAFLCDGAV